MSPNKASKLNYYLISLSAALNLLLPCGTMDVTQREEQILTADDSVP